MLELLKGGGVLEGMSDIPGMYLKGMRGKTGNRDKLDTIAWKQRDWRMPEMFWSVLECWNPL